MGLPNISQGRKSNVIDDDRFLFLPVEWFNIKHTFLGGKILLILLFKRIISNISFYRISNIATEENRNKQKENKY